MTIVKPTSLDGSTDAPKSSPPRWHARTFKTMTPHVARGYYGGAVVFFGGGTKAGSEEQGIVDRGRRYRRGCRCPSGGGTRRAVRTDEGASPNRNALVVDRRACPVRPGRHERDRKSTRLNSSH